MNIRPRILKGMPGYDLQRFGGDSLSGLIVGVIAVPLSIAVAVASGVGPEQGLATAVIAGVVVALFGGGSVQVSGPTGTFVVISYAIGAQYGYAGLALATAMAGVMMVIMGFANLGKIIQYVPYPVVIGFSSGIATVILVSQLGDLLGISMLEAPPDAPTRLLTYAQRLGSVSVADTLVSLTTVSVLILWKRVSQRVPGALIAIIGVTAVVALFDLPVVTIGSRFGTLPRGLQWYGFPSVSFALVQELMVPAFTIALLSSIESLFTAMVADGMIGERHDPNTELVGEGLANVAVTLFGGIPASGAIARTATSARNGGRTPVAAVMNAAFVLLVMSALAPLASFIPIAALASVLAVVAWNMAEWRSFRAMVRGPKSDMVVLLTTFSLTVIIDLSVAIQVGMVLASFLFMRRMSMVSQVTVLRSERRQQRYEELQQADINVRTTSRAIPKDVEVYEINGAFFFGAAEKFRNAMLLIQRRPKVRILGMRSVNALDMTGLRLLEDLANDARTHGGHIILARLQPQPERALRKSGLYDQIGGDNVCDTLEDALRRARVLTGTA